MATSPLRPLRRPGRRLSDRRTRATTSRRSSTTPAARRRRRPKAIDFTPGRAARQRLRRARPAHVPRGARATRWSSPRTRTARTRVFERELPDAEVVISQPFWPAYLTAERIAKAPNLKLAITAGIGSDHVDLQAAIERGITVAEVTYCNSISVAEHVVMMILSLVRNYIPSYQIVVDGGWNIADCVVALVRPRGHAGRHGRRRADRLGGAAPAEAVRRRPALHRPPPAAGGGRGGAGRHLPPGRGVDGARSATSSRSTRRCTRRPSTCSTTS